MGSSFIITESSLNKTGRKLMLNFFNFVHDSYMLTYEVFQKQKKFYDENVIDEYKNFKKNKDYVDEIIFKLEDIEKKIKNCSIEVEFVYNFLHNMDSKLNLDKNDEIELHEDLYFLKKTFFKAYELFYFDGYMLED